MIRGRVLVGSYKFEGNAPEECLDPFDSDLPRAWVSFDWSVLSGVVYCDLGCDLEGEMGSSRYRSSIESASISWCRSWNLLC